MRFTTDRQPFSVEINIPIRVLDTCFKNQNHIDTGNLNNPNVNFIEIKIREYIWEFNSYIKKHFYPSTTAK